MRHSSALATDRDRTRLKETLSRRLDEPPREAAERARSAFDALRAACEARFVLFGAGNMGRSILASLRKDGINPLAFADNRIQLWGKSVDRLQVLSPQDAATAFGGNSAFIVTIYNQAHSFKETRRFLRGLGCRWVESVIPVRWKYWESFLPYYRDDLPQKVLLDRNEILDTFDVWADEDSRREYVDQVLWRLDGEFDGVRDPAPDVQYFPLDLIGKRRDETFVDVGAYDGDTIRTFLKFADNLFDRIIAIEPDPGNFERLARFVEDLPPQIAPRIRMCRVAAAGHAGQVTFHEANDLSSRIAFDGGLAVDCVTLDALLAECSPTLVKLDVEGSELAALEGARLTLSRARPVVAACVYHTQGHLWQVPRAIGSDLQNYKYFLRTYRPDCWETVCYAVPSERANPDVARLNSLK